VYSDKTVIVCDEKRRQELIAQRQRLLEQEAKGTVIKLNGDQADSQATGRKVETAVTSALPEQETQSSAKVGAGDGIVTQDQSPAPKQDPLSQWRESIRTAATRKGNFGTYPEEEIY
jgi:hypothetical protein